MYYPGDIVQVLGDELSPWSVRAGYQGTVVRSDNPMDGIDGTLVTFSHPYGGTTQQLWVSNSGLALVRRAPVPPPATPTPVASRGVAERIIPWGTVVTQWAHSVPDSAVGLAQTIAFDEAITMTIDESLFGAGFVAKAAEKAHKEKATVVKMTKKNRSFEYKVRVRDV